MRFLSLNIMPEAPSVLFPSPPLSCKITRSLCSSFATCIFCITGNLRSSGVMPTGNNPSWKAPEAQATRHPTTTTGVWPYPPPAAGAMLESSGTLTPHLACNEPANQCYRLESKHVRVRSLWSPSELLSDNSSQVPSPHSNKKPIGE